VRGRKGDVTVEQDEGVRPGTTADRLAALPAAFSQGGTITAGSASQLSYGARAVVVMSAELARLLVSGVALVTSDDHAGRATRVPQLTPSMVYESGL
jgi:acetyl-CoA acetyltransferase